MSKVAGSMTLACGGPWNTDNVCPLVDLNIFDPEMSLDEIVQLNSILSTPKKTDPRSPPNERPGAKRKATSNADTGWEGVTVLEVKRRKKNENGKKKPPDSSPESSPTFYRKLSTVAMIHRHLSSRSADSDDDEEEVRNLSFKSDVSTDCDAALPATPKSLHHLHKYQSLSLPANFDEIRVVESLPVESSCLTP